MSGAEQPDAQFENLLEYLRQSRGFDFTGYKRPSLMRRIARRMQTVDAATFADYIDYLEVHPEEFGVLFNTILINVTAFFRDPIAWQRLKETVIPRLADKAPGETIRVWSAGCASGEEAYSIAILLCEALGREDFKRRVKIYGTDADEDALAIARQAGYAPKDMDSLPHDDLRGKYFEMAGGRYVFNAELRRSVIFGRHDLVQDAPMSRLDLLICRNVLMYFNSETQARILGRFNYALNDSGCLFLGKAETLLVHSYLFTTLDLKQRIFCKQTDASLRDRLLVFGQPSAEGVDLGHHAARHGRLRDAAFEVGELPQIVVAANGSLVLANQQARRLFGIDPKDIGRPFQDLELSYRPVELRSVIEQAYAEQKVVGLSNVEGRFKSGERRYFEVHVAPLRENDTVVGAYVTFNDVTSYHELEDEVKRARDEEQSVTAELQATNEELQSTNEELETTNEELQSTNEELETMNEELYATNEELQTMNEELRERTDELKDSAQFLSSILSSLRGGVVVVDRNFSVLVWNKLSEELWGVRFDEVKGKSLLKLDIGLPVDRLREPVRASMNGSNDASELIVDAVNRRGRKIKCRVVINPFQAPRANKEGAVIMMEEMGM